MGRVVKRYLATERAANLKGSLGEKFKKAKWDLPAHFDYPHFVQKKPGGEGRLRVHVTGAESSKVFSFKAREGFKTLKVMREKHPEAVGKGVPRRFELMKRLAELGAPIAKPLRLSKKGDNEFVWEAEYGGINVARLLRVASPTEAKTIEALFEKAHSELMAFQARTGIILSDTKIYNTVYNPRTRRVKFIDLRIVRTPEDVEELRRRVGVKGKTRQTTLESFSR